MTRVFLSYSADSEEHRARVGELAQQLRREGVEATLEGAAREAAREAAPEAAVDASIDAADVVLVICSERYRRAFDGGPGGSPELARIAGLARGEPARVVPVVLEDGEPRHVPAGLRGVHAVYLPEQWAQLLRRLGATGKPLPPPPPMSGAPRAPSGPPAGEPVGMAPARRITNVSLPGAADFVGRPMELEQIGKVLGTPRQAGGCEPLIVVGAAGLGKTALVLEYAVRHLEAYDVVWLARAGTESTIRLDLALLARELGLGAPGAPGIVDEETEVMAARSWLGSHDRWLLIFDDAPGGDAVAPYVPRPQRGHVLVTSRGSGWGAVGKKLVLGALAREESIELLRRASGRGDAAGADELAAWLEGRPLMAKLAGSLARDRGVSFDVLHGQLIAEAGERPGHRLEALIAMAIEDARRRSPASLALIELIAYLSPHEIPIRLLREHVEHLAPELAAVARDDGALVRLLDELVRFGLVTRDGDALAVHAAVQSAIRPSARGGAAVALLEAAFAWDEERPETWAAAEELLPHVLVAIEDPHAPAVRPRELERLLARAATCTWKRGEPKRAVELQRRAVALSEHRGGGAAGGGGPGELEPRLLLASALASLGSMLGELGELTEAAVHLERASGLLEAPAGSSATAGSSAMAASTATAGSSATAVLVRRELARVDAARGDFAGARARLEGALRIDRERLGADEHLSIAVTLSELSGVEVDAGRLEEGAELLERALAMLGRVLATDEHPLVAATLRRSAVLLERRGDLAGARARLERALELLRGVFRTDHHVTIVEVMNDLAGVLLRLGETVGAQRLLEHTLDAQARLFGGSAGPSGAIVAGNLARVLLVQGDVAGARRQLERTLAELQARGLMAHRATALILEQLAELDRSRDLGAARARLEQALEIRRVVLPADSPETIHTEAHLAQILVKLDAADAARRVLEPALARVAAWPALRSIGEADALFAVADGLRAIGEPGRVRALLEGRVAAYERAPGHDAAALARGKLALARVLLELADLAEARRAAHAAYELCADVLGRQAPASGMAALLCADVALAGGDAARAFSDACRALRIFTGRDDELTRDRAARALELAARAALARGRRATAAALLQRSLERHDAPEVREALFVLIEELAAAGKKADVAPAVALLAGLAPSWLADRVFASARLEGAQITGSLEIALSITGACVGAALASQGGLPEGYGWRLELAPIRAEGEVSEVRTLPVRARYAGRGALVLLADSSELPWGTYLLTVRFVDSPRDVWRADVTISNVELGNPFVAGPPVRDERFFGRARLLGDTMRDLGLASIVLLGPRRAGKTSVLYRLAQLCAIKWTVVHIDLHGYAGIDSRVFLSELAGQIARAAGLPTPEEDRPLLALRRGLQGASKKRILLLLDEMAVLAQYPDIALQLRAMAKWEPPTVRIIMAGTSRDLDRLSETSARGSSPVNEFLNREVDQLTHEEARLLLEQPVLGRYRYEPVALERLIELGAGRPFFLNALARDALEAVRHEGGRVIKAAHVEAARQEAPITLARWYRELVDELDELSRSALPVLIDEGGEVPLIHADALRSAGIVVGPRRALMLDPIFIDWWRRGRRRPR